MSRRAKLAAMAVAASAAVVPVSGASAAQKVPFTIDEQVDFVNQSFTFTSTTQQLCPSGRFVDTALADAFAAGRLSACGMRSARAPPAQIAPRHRVDTGAHGHLQPEGRNGPVDDAKLAGAASRATREFRSPGSARVVRQTRTDHLPPKPASFTLRRRTASASPSRTATVSSQPIHPSVMLWP